MPKRRNECSKLHCSEPPVSGGLCLQHDAEHTAEKVRWEDGLETLNKSVIDGRIVAAGPLRDELHRIQDVWNQVCAAENANSEHPVFKEETHSAVSWCIEIAALIADEERAMSKAKPGDISAYKYHRESLVGAVFES